MLVHLKYSYLEKWIGDSDMKKKQHFVKYHLYSFFLKNCYGLLKLITCSDNCGH